MYSGEGRDTTNGRWPGGGEVRVQEASGQDRGRDSGCIPGSDMAQCDAAGVNGSNRILFHGAPRLRMMPKGCLGSPVLVLLFGLDRGFLMDVGPFLKEFVKRKRFSSDRLRNGGGGRRSRPFRVCWSQSMLHSWRCHFSGFVSVVVAT